MSEGRPTHPNYSSGEDYILEFRSFRYGFNSLDFTQRLEMAAVELDLVEAGTLDECDCYDLVQLVTSRSVDQPVSGLGEYLAENAEEVLVHEGECLVYWLQELVFRSAWLDQRLLDEQVDLVFDDSACVFVYYPKGNRTREIGPPPHPSWRRVAYLP
jgi:hypothetical protein